MIDRIGLALSSTGIMLAPLLAASMAALKVSAETQLIALTGQLEPSVGQAVLLGMTSATLNSGGEIAFQATLQHGVGGVGEENDRAIWRWDGTAHELLAWRGVTASPGGGVFGSFQAPSIGDAGEVAVIGSTASGAQGIWRFAPTQAGSLIASTATGGAPGVADATFSSLGPTILHAPGDVIAYNAVLTQGVGGVSVINDRGVWLDDSGSGSLLSRERVTPVPGLSGAQVNVFNATAVNDQSQTAVLGGLVIGPGGITTAMAQGIWRLSPSGGDLIALRGAGGVAGLPGASFLALNEPTISSSGSVAFTATLEGGGVTAANHRGVWLHDGSSSELLVRSGAEPAGVPGAAFAEFGDPLLNDMDEVLIRATLAEGLGGVASANATGLWRWHSAGVSLLSRTGVGGVPGVPAASFAEYGSLAFNAQGVAAVHATLAAGVGGVTEENDEGLWLLSSAGGTLVARTGDTLEGRTISDLDFTGGSSGGDGRPRSFNDESQLVFKATFTNGDEGLFLFSPDTSGPSADFNLDGQITGADLVRWKSGFGMSGVGQPDGDADGDQDVDGHDFLSWQRQLGVNVPATAVPEPTIAGLLLSALLVSVLRLSRRASPSVSLEQAVNSADRLS